MERIVKVSRKKIRTSWREKQVIVVLKKEDGRDVGLRFGQCLR